MAQISGFMNVYRSGWFHRLAKPGTCDRHGGDLYLSEAAAKADIHPLTHYIATIPVSWEDPETLSCNPQESKPIPLSQSRSLQINKCPFPEVI